MAVVVVNIIGIICQSDGYYSRYTYLCVCIFIPARSRRENIMACFFFTFIYIEMTFDRNRLCILLYNKSHQKITHSTLCI